MKVILRKIKGWKRIRIHFSERFSAHASVALARSQSKLHVISGARDRGLHSVYSLSLAQSDGVSVCFTCGRVRGGRGGRLCIRDEVGGREDMGGGWKYLNDARRTVVGRTDRCQMKSGGEEGCCECRCKMGSDEGRN